MDCPMCSKELTQPDWVCSPKACPQGWPLAGIWNLADRVFYTDIKLALNGMGGALHLDYLCKQYGLC